MLREAERARLAIASSKYRGASAASAIGAVLGRWPNFDCVLETATTARPAYAAPSAFALHYRFKRSFDCVRRSD